MKPLSSSSNEKTDKPNPVEISPEQGAAKNPTDKVGRNKTRMPGLPKDRQPTLTNRTPAEKNILSAAVKKENFNKEENELTEDYANSGNSIRVRTVGVDGPFVNKEKKPYSKSSSSSDADTGLNEPEISIVSQKNKAEDINPVQKAATNIKAGCVLESMLEEAVENLDAGFFESMSKKSWSYFGRNAINVVLNVISKPGMTESIIEGGNSVISKHLYRGSVITKDQWEKIASWSHQRKDLALGSLLARRLNSDFSEDDSDHKVNFAVIMENTSHNLSHKNAHLPAFQKKVYNLARGSDEADIKIIMETLVGHQRANSVLIPIAARAIDEGQLDLFESMWRQAPDYFSQNWIEIIESVLVSSIPDPFSIRYLTKFIDSMLAKGGSFDAERILKILDIDNRDEYTEFRQFILARQAEVAGHAKPVKEIGDS